MPKLPSSKSEFVPQVRAVSLGTYVEVVTRLGADPYALLRKMKIRAEELADPEGRLAASVVAKLAEETARETGCEALALLMIEPRSFASLGPISLLLQHRKTMREVIGSIAKHQRLLGDLTDHILDDDGEWATVRVDILPGFGTRQTSEFAVALLFRTLRDLSDDRWQPECIHFRHAAPADMRVHQRFFQCPIQFDSDFDGISCPSSSLDITNRSANEAMAGHAEQCLQLFAGQAPVVTVTDQVRRAINSLLSRCNVTMESVADNLGLHPRMLQRLLEKEGATFAALMNEIRRELAVRYLSTSNHSVTDVGMLLGYSTLSSFSRWFAVEFGKSPAAWRSAEREPVACERDYRVQRLDFPAGDTLCA